MSKTAGFAFRRRYNLAPTDPRFMGCTTADIVLDIWAHRHTDDPSLRNELENPDFDQDLADMEAEEGIPPEGGVDGAPDPGDFDDEVI